MSLGKRVPLKPIQSSALPFGKKSRGREHQVLPFKPDVTRKLTFEDDTLTFCEPHEEVASILDDIHPPSNEELLNDFLEYIKTATEMPNNTESKVSFLSELNTASNIEFASDKKRRTPQTSPTREERFDRSLTLNITEQFNEGKYKTMDLSMTDNVFDTSPPKPQRKPFQSKFLQKSRDEPVKLKRKPLQQVQPPESTGIKLTSSKRLNDATFDTEIDTAAFEELLSKNRQDPRLNYDETETEIRPIESMTPSTFIPKKKAVEPRRTVTFEPHQNKEKIKSIKQAPLRKNTIQKPKTQLMMPKSYPELIQSKFHDKYYDLVRILPFKITKLKSTLKTPIVTTIYRGNKTEFEIEDSTPLYTKIAVLQRQKRLRNEINCIMKKTPFVLFDGLYLSFIISSPQYNLRFAVTTEIPSYYPWCKLKVSMIRIDFGAKPEELKPVVEQIAASIPMCPNMITQFVDKMVNNFVAQY